MSEMAGNGWEVINKKKRNYCFTANYNQLRDIFTSPYIDKVVWDSAVCAGIISLDAFQTLLDDTFGDHLVVNNTASATFNTSGGGWSLRAGDRTKDTDTIFTVKDMKIPKTIKISYTYGTANMNATRLVFRTTQNEYVVWSLNDGHTQAGGSTLDKVTICNTATTLHSWSNTSTATISYTDTVDVETQCTNCFTDGEDICEFSLLQCRTYNGYATNPCYIKSLEIYC